MADLKYAAKGDQIVKRSTLEPIPEDEPIFILRARDNISLVIVLIYTAIGLLAGCTDFHIDGCIEAVCEFWKFLKSFPSRMKQPGITLGR